MGLIKFIIAVVLLPIVVAAARAFVWEVGRLPLNVYQVLVSGIIAYLICHLFVVSLKTIYDFGQKAFAESMKFSPFLANYLPAFLPVIPMLILLALYITNALTKGTKLEPYFIFFFSFTLTMHIVLTAQSLYSEDNTAIKAHYFLVMSVAFLLNVVFISLMLDLTFPSFSAISFLGKAWENMKDYYIFFYDRFCLPTK